jgi:polyhydroxyalkanoate synthesis regulator phasin
MSVFRSPLIDVSVDTEALQAALDERPTEDRVQELLAEKVESYVDDHVESLRLVDEGDVDTQINDALDSRDFTPDVEGVLNDYDFSRVDAIEGLETRVETLESRVDEVESADDESLNRLQERVRVLESAGHNHAHDHTVVQAMTARIEALEAKLDAIGTEQTEAMTLLDLLRRAFAIITRTR